MRQRREHVAAARASCHEPSSVAPSERGRVLKCAGARVLMVSVVEGESATSMCRVRAENVS